jgi:multidrug efflux pump subunit AcrB
VWEGDYGIPVMLKTATSDRATADDLRNEPMPVMLGVDNAPLRQFAALDPQWHLGMVSHRNGIPTITLSAEVQRGVNVTARTKALMKELDKVQLPQGATISYGGEWENSMEMMPHIMAALGIAVVIIFFILLFHYTDVGISFLLLLSLILCIPGAGVGIWVMRSVISLTSLLGIISLMGILVRNAIVLIDFAQELCRQGMPMRQAVAEAARRRMRPIFLTSAAATMGVVPMVIGGSALWKPMGIVIFWGTPITMLFILTVIPVAYCKLKDRSKSK